MTAWVLVAVGEARSAGWSAGDWPAMAVSYLRSQLVTVPAGLAPRFQPPSVDERAFLYYAVQHATGDGSYLNSALALTENSRDQLSSWGQSYLLLALVEAGHPTDSTQVRGLVASLNARTILTANGNHWEEPRIPGSIESNLSMTALVLRALLAADPAHPLLEATTRWLVASRDARRWETDVQRAQALLALGAFAEATGEQRGDVSYRVQLDGTDVLAGRLGGAEPFARALMLPLADISAGEVHRLSFQRESSTGRLYYVLNLRYLTPAREVEALSRGLSVAHQYTALADPSRPITQARVGDVVRVTVTVVSDADRRFVQVADLLPAGLEAVDTTLATVPDDVRRVLEEERRAAAEAGAEVGAAAPWMHWYWSPWDQTQVRDDRFALFATSLPRGVHQYVYYARATTPGDFFVAPAHAEEAAFPEVFGRSDSARFTVLP